MQFAFGVNNNMATAHENTSVANEPDMDADIEIDPMDHPVICGFVKRFKGESLEDEDAAVTARINELLHIGPNYRFTTRIYIDIESPPASAAEDRSKPPVNTDQ